MSALSTIFRKKPAQPVGMACSIPIGGGAMACSMPMSGGAGGPGAGGMDLGGSCAVPLAALSIIELFQSQGCASCPPAAGLVHAAANNPNALLLTYNVTYFDSKGWRDTLAQPAWDRRQRAYNSRWARASLFTPQLVVNGAFDGTAGSEPDIQALLGRAMDGMRAMQWTAMLDIVGGEVKISSNMPTSMPTPEQYMGEAAASHAPAMGTESYELFVAAYDPHPQTVKMNKGANKGKKLVHRNVVQQLTKIADWEGGDKRVTLPAMRRDALERVLFLQASGGGPIIAAVKV